MFGSSRETCGVTVGLSGYDFNCNPPRLDNLERTTMLEKPKKRSTSDIDACQVCGDQVAGRYFGAHVCMPCKIFFLRNHDKGDVLSCSGIASNGTCVINKSTRTNCSSCRYKKCIQVGMAKKERPEVVQPLNGQKLCMVCSDIANGIHFGVVSCEGCKKFFRRSMGEQDKYKCRGQQQCPINPRSRNTCRFCRYQKCLVVGMSPEVGKKDHMLDSTWKQKLQTPLTSTTAAPVNMSPHGKSSPQSTQADSCFVPTFQSQHSSMPPPFHMADYNQARGIPPQPAAAITHNSLPQHSAVGQSGFFSNPMNTITPYPQVKSEHASTAPSSFPHVTEMSPMTPNCQRDACTPSLPVDLSMEYPNNSFNNSCMSPLMPNSSEFQPRSPEFLPNPSPGFQPSPPYSAENQGYQFNQSSTSPANNTMYDSDSLSSRSSSSSVSPTAQDMQSPHHSSRSLDPDRVNRRIKRIFSSIDAEVPSVGSMANASPNKVKRLMTTSRETSPDKQLDPTLLDIAKKLEIKDNDARQVYAPIMKECLSIFRPHEFTNTVVSKTVNWMHEHDPGSDPSWVFKLMDVESLRKFEVGYTILDDILKYFTVDNPSGPLVDINIFFEDMYQYAKCDVESGPSNGINGLVQSKLLNKISSKSRKPLTNPAVNGIKPPEVTDGAPKPLLPSKVPQDPQMKKLIDLVDKYRNCPNAQAKMTILSQAHRNFYTSDYWLNTELPDKVLSLTDEYKMIIRSVARSLQQYTFSFIWDRLLLYQQYNTSSEKNKSRMDFTAKDVQKFLIEYLDKQASAMAGFVADLPAWKMMDKHDQLHIIYKMMPLRIMCMALYMYDPQGKLIHPVAWNWYNWPWMEFIRAFSGMCEELLALEVDLIEASLTLVLAGIAADSSALQKPELIEEVRKPFQGALIAYLQKKYGLSKWKGVMKQLLTFVPKMRILYAWFGSVWQNIIFSISQ